MLQEGFKTERGKFLLSHLYNCQKCYDEWAKIGHSLPSNHRIAKLEEIIHYIHPSSTIRN